MTDEPKILIQNNAGGVVNILIVGNNHPPVIIDSDSNILDVKPSIEVLPGATDNNEIDDAEGIKNALQSGEKTNDTGGHNQEQKSKLVDEKQKVNLSDSPIVSCLSYFICLVVMIGLVISFWPFILVGGFLLLIVTVLVRGFWFWLKDKFS